LPLILYEENSMQAADGKVVAFHFTLTNDAGEILDQSDEGSGLVYLHGHGQLIPGLEWNLAGKEAGDQFSVTLPPEDAYGERDDEMIQTIPRSAFQEGAEIKAGMQFEAQGEDGDTVVTVASVEGDEVTIDGNHPLAGLALTFEVEVAQVRDATEEEMEHGHAHEPGGHHDH
jgi:FKBP-type peptidyl-prolyl cis-trans isomerase SlyD